MQRLAFFWRRFPQGGGAQGVPLRLIHMPDGHGYITQQHHTGAGHGGGDDLEPPIALPQHVQLPFLGQRHSIGGQLGTGFGGSGVLGFGAQGHLPGANL